MSEVAAVEVVDVVSPFKAAQEAAKASFEAALGSATEQGFIPTKSVMGYMKTDDFISLREFGLNRDVEKRVKADRNTHLKGELTSEQQRKVGIVLTSDSNNADFFNESAPFMKIDGHSRCAAWVNGNLVKPEFVSVEFFFNLSDTEIVTEYKVFTESKAQATQAEKNNISNKMQHFEPKSAFCKQSWKNAFALALGGTYEEGLIEYRPILDMVDSWGVTPEVGAKSTKRHVSGVKFAIIDTFDSEDTSNWETFWKDFFAEQSAIKTVITLRDEVKNLLGQGSSHDKAIKNACAKAFKKFDKAN